MSKPKMRPSGWLWVVVAIASLMAASLVLLATRHGAGVTADTIVYYNAADFLLEGKGFSRMAAEVGYKPITHFPPLYPASLAAIKALGVDLETGARWLNAAAAAGLVWLTAVLLQHEKGASWISALGSVVVAFSPILLDVFAWAMSEALFIFLVILSLASALAYLRTHHRRPLIWTGLLGAMTYLTRYSGLALIGALGLVILVVPKLTWKERLRDVSLYGAAALIPAAAWMVRNLLVAGSTTNRQLAWHLITATQLKRWFHLLFGWLLPFKFTHIALLLSVGVIAVIVIGALVYQFRRRFQPMIGYLKSLPDHPLRLLSGWFSLVYAIFLMASISFFDVSTPLDFRITSPMYVTLLLFALTHLPEDRNWYTSNRLRQLILVGVAVLAGSYGFRSVVLADELSKDARGYATSLLDPASQIELIQDLPSDVIIYSNNLEAMYYYYHRPALIIPYAVDSVSHLVRSDFDQQLELMRGRLRQGDGVLIIFFSANREGYPPPILIEGLEQIYNRHDVMIYTGPGMGDRFLP